MKKIILVNITSWTRIGSIDAEHFYASISEIETNRSVFSFADVDGDNRMEVYESKELKKVLNQINAGHLNAKERCHSYNAGDKTNKFNSIEEIKNEVKRVYPGCDIIFFNDGLLMSDNDIFVTNPEPIKKTGKKIRIHNFEGFSKEFVNLTEGSVHEVIETPERYKYKELQSGVWVWGVTEPVLVLEREFEYIKS